MNKTKQQKKRSSQIQIPLMILSQPKEQQLVEQQIKPSRFKVLISKICPCLSMTTSRLTKQRNSKDSHQQTKSSINTKPNSQDQQQESKKDQKDELMTLETLVNEQRKGKGTVFSSLHEISNKYNDENLLSQSSLRKWHGFPVSRLPQNQMLVVGSSNLKLLCRVKSVQLQPTKTAVALTKKSKLYSSSAQKSLYSQSYLDKYWQNRYFLFEKFDEGISINDQSWPIVVPEAVSEYISEMLKCETVVNLSCGVGGDAIKLANSCRKVIAWDSDESNLRCAHVNSRVYSSDNIQIVSGKVQNLQKYEPHLVFISSYTKLEQDSLSQLSCTPSSLFPSLQPILSSALALSSSIVLLLPGNMNIDLLASAIAKEINQQKIVAQTCCMKIQKIFYIGQLKYIAVYLAGRISQSMAINDQIQWIYKQLKIQGKKAMVTGKKFIKKLREIYGMVQLLNFIIQSKKVEIGEEPIEKLYHYVKKNNLMSQQKLNKLVLQREEQQKQAALSKQTNPNEESQQIQKTVSQTSMPSIINRISTDQMNLDQEHDPYKSLPIKSNQQSYKPRSLIYSKKNGIDSPSRQENQNNRESAVEKYKPVHKSNYTQQI